MAESRIPIENLYYLLCYAWDKLEEKETLAVDPIEGGRVVDLLGRVLANGTAHLLRRGLDRGYVSVSEELRTIRGRIVFGECVKRQLLKQARVHVQYDELSHDVLHNRILKSTLTRLVRTRAVDDGVRDQCHDVARRMGGVEEVELTELMFRSVQLSRQTSVYDFLIRVCELLVENLLPTEREGPSRFREFERDEKKMAALFEEFVRNFYKREQDEYHLTREIISWAMTPEDDAAAALLPQMRTDVSLISQARHLVIDTKYYQEALVSRFDSEKLRSAHLYQLHAYMSNLASVSAGVKLVGMLLYPTVDEEFDHQYQMADAQLRVATINLAEPWQAIHNRLLALLP